MTGFLDLAQHEAGETAAAGKSGGLGGSTIDKTAGFTDPKYNVSRVEVAAPAVGGGQDAVVGVPASTPAGSAAGAATAGATGLQNAVLGSESMNSIGVIITLWTIRAYFCLIMLAWARTVVRQHIAATGQKSSTYTSASTDSGLAENPFAPHKPEGRGWTGKLGRAMLSVGRSYWLGSDEDDSWMYGMKFRTTKIQNPEAGGPGGVQLNTFDGPAERERRRR